jgi:hypothetical protein
MTVTSWSKHRAGRCHIDRQGKAPLIFGIYFFYFLSITVMLTSLIAPTPFFTYSQAQREIQLSADYCDGGVDHPRGFKS